MTKPDNKKRKGADQMPETATPGADTIVQFGGRIPSSLRRRVRMAAASQDIDAQTALRQALEEYVTKRGF